MNINNNVSIQINISLHPIHLPTNSTNNITSLSSSFFINYISHLYLFFYFTEFNNQIIDNINKLTSLHLPFHIDLSSIKLTYFINLLNAINHNGARNKICSIKLFCFFHKKPFSLTKLPIFHMNSYKTNPF